MIATNKNLQEIQYYIPSERGDDKTIKLDWNECTLKFDSCYLDKLRRGIDTISFNEYPNINNHKLVHKLSTYCGVSSENIQIFNGSDSALHYIFACFCNPETRVVVYFPNYTQIETYIRLYSNNLTYSNVSDIFGGHVYDFSEVEDYDVVYLSNPNNPTGAIIDTSTIEQLLLKYPNKLFIIDEAYYEFSKISSSSLVLNYDNLVICRTFSKAFSLAAIRLGYICAHVSIVNQINKIRNTKEVNSFAQSLAMIALENIDFVEERVNTVIRNREFFTAELKNMGIEYVDSSANFVLLRMKNSKLLIDNLKSRGILVRDRSTLEGLEDCVRITIGEIQDMETVLEEIKKINIQNEHECNIVNRVG